MSNLIKVDFPAPFGPMTPTRLNRAIRADGEDVQGRCYLDNVSAQLTSIRFGVLFPG